MCCALSDTTYIELNIKDMFRCAMWSSHGVFGEVRILPGLVYSNKITVFLLAMFPTYLDKLCVVALNVWLKLWCYYDYHYIKDYMLRHILELFLDITPT